MIVTVIGACAVQIALCLSLFGLQNVAGEVLAMTLDSADHPGIHGLRQLLPLVDPD